MNHILSYYFAKRGISYQTSVPYCLEANGQMEPEMTTIKDIARAMLHSDSLPKFLWTEAIATCVNPQSC